MQQRLMKREVINLKESVKILEEENGKEKQCYNMKKKKNLKLES